MNWPLYFAYVIGSIVVSLIGYLALTGSFYYRYYVRRREQAADWKIQPNRFLPYALNRHAVLLGSFNMTMASVISGSLAYYVFTGGKSALYFDWRERSALYVIVSTVALFIVTDLGAYLAHRAYHGKFLFQKVHKWHHRYGAPTPFTVTAMHPVEFLTYQTIFIIPMFVVPMHVAVYYGLLIWIFYYNTCDHSGIKHKAWAPWQPPSQFHDDHHKFFHCNFGQSLLLWDRVFGTLRRVGRKYGEHVYGGRGAAGDKPAEENFVDYRAL